MLFVCHSSMSEFAFALHRSLHLFKTWDLHVVYSVESKWRPNDGGFSMEWAGVRVLLIYLRVASPQSCLLFSQHKRLHEERESKPGLDRDRNLQRRVTDLASTVNKLEKKISTLKSENESLVGNIPSQYIALPLMFLWWIFYVILNPFPLNRHTQQYLCF